MKILRKLNWAAVLAVCINTSSADPAYWLKIDLKTALANFQLLLKVSMESSNVFAHCTMYNVHVLGHRAASPIHPISPKWTTLEVEIRFRTGEVVTFKLQTNFFSSPVYTTALSIEPFHISRKMLYISLHIGRFDTRDSFECVCVCNVSTFLWERYLVGLMIEPPHQS